MTASSTTSSGTSKVRTPDRAPGPRFVTVNVTSVDPLGCTIDGSAEPVTSRSPVGSTGGVGTARVVRSAEAAGVVPLPVSSGSVVLVRTPTASVTTSTSTRHEVPAGASPLV